MLIMILFKIYKVIHIKVIELYDVIIGCIDLPGLCRLIRLYNLGIWGFIVVIYFGFN